MQEQGLKESTAETSESSIGKVGSFGPLWHLPAVSVVKRCSSGAGESAVLWRWLGARSVLIVHVQWLLQWRSSQPQDAAFDACISATTVAVANAVASHGLRALQAPSVKAGIACIAHKENAALILRSLLQCPQLCKDAAGDLCVSITYGRSTDAAANC